MSMKTQLDVDAGNISIIPHDVAVKYGINKVHLKHGLFKDIRANSSSITVTIPNCWNGDNEETVDTEDGNLYYVGDACYIIKDWDRFMKDTNYLKEMPEGCVCINTGGDGVFTVIID